MTFKKFHFTCVQNHDFENMQWDTEASPACPTCGEASTFSERGSRGASAAVHGDEIDIMVRHGVCNDDGTPRRFTSKEELKRAAAKKGLFYGDETPNPLPEVRDRFQQAEEQRRNERSRWERQ